MLVDTYNSEGKETSKTQLPKEIFDKEVNIDLIRQVVFGILSNKRQNIAHTKDRSEVSGGGRKPWRQKGTGRARHGSIRSPLWRHGGVTFGPRNDKNYKKLLTPKTKKAALFAALSGKVKDNEVLIIEKLDLKEAKTKEASKTINTILKGANKTGGALIVISENDKKLKLAIRNIKNISVIQAKDINAADVVGCKNLIFIKDSIKELEKFIIKK
jgi:large subunit ribosomal protein L4